MNKIDFNNVSDEIRGKLYKWAAGHFLSGWDQNLSGLELEEILTADENSSPELLEEQEEILIWDCLSTGNTQEDCHHVDELIWTLINSLNDILDILPDIQKLANN